MPLTNRRLWLLSGLIAGVIAITVGAVWNHRRSIKLAKAEIYLERADKEASQKLAIRLHELKAFFDEAKSRTPLFADDAMGIGTKFKYVRQYSPIYTVSEQEFRTHVQSMFSEHVFSPEQLRQTVLQTIKGYQDDVDAIENRMLVQIEIDSGDLPQQSAESVKPSEKSRVAFDTAMTKAIERIPSDLGADISKLLATNVAASVLEASLTGTLSRLTVSGAVLGIGGATSWETAGLSILGAVAIDYVISKSWDWIADPKGKMAAEINKQIDLIKQVIIDGDGTNPGIAKILEDARLKRQKLRREAVYNIL